MKTFKLFTAALLAVLMLSACATAPTPSPEASSSTTSESKLGVSQEASATAPSEGKTIKWLMGYQATDPNLEPPKAKIEEVTGYKVEIFMLPAENSDEKLNLEMASNAAYDIVKLTPNQFYMLAGKGALAPLNDLIVQHGPNVQAAIKEDEWVAGTLDGQVMAIPQFDARYVGGGIAYNVKMFTDAGAEMKPDMTIAEFEAALKKVQEKFPGVSPYTGNQAFDSGLTSAYGVSTHNFTETADGKATALLMQAGTKDYVTDMNRLYNDKLLDQDWPTNTGEQVNEKFTSGQAASAWMGWWNATTINEAVMKNTSSEVGYVHPLFSADNKTAVYPVNNGTTGYAAIPKSCKQPEIAMQFMNAVGAPESFPRIFLGEEGTQYEIRDIDGKKEYWPIFPAFQEWFNGHYFNLVLPSDTFTTLWLCRVRKSEELYAAFEKMNTFDQTKWVNKALAYAPPLPNVSKFSQALDKFQKDTVIEFIAGSKPLTDWDTFLTKWENDGGTAMIQDVDSYMASLK